jgi:hypothetical protein
MRSGAEFIYRAATRIGFSAADITSAIGTLQTCRPAMTMSAPGEDRKSWADRQNDANDPFRMSRILPIRVRARDFVLSDAIAC